MRKEKKLLHREGEISLHKVFTEEDRVILTVQIRCPFEGEPVKGRGMKRITRFYQTVFGAYRRYCTERLQKQLSGECRQCLAQGRAYTPCEAQLCYHITHRDGSLLSLYYERIETRGEQTVCVLRYSDTWRLRTGRMLTLEEVMENSGKRMLTEQIIQTVPLLGEQHFFPRWRKLVKKYLNVNRFYVRGDQVILYFQPGTIAPFDRGVWEFPVGGLLQQRPSDGIVPPVQTL